MHHTIDYSGLSGEEKRNKALQDLREWLTEKQWDICYTFYLHCEKLPAEGHFELTLGLVGVSGYPVQAFREMIIEEREFQLGG